MRFKIGDIPEFDNDKLNKIMENKANVPTMGGIIILAGILLPTLLLADLTNFYIHMALLCTAWLAVVGGVDDWLKLSAKKRGGTRDGLKMWEKLMFQLGLGVVLAYFIYLHGSHNVPAGEIASFHKLYVPFLKGVEGAYTIPLGIFMVVAVLVIAGTSNAVNFTDGLDGLAGGCTAMVSFAFMLVAFAVGTQDLAEHLLLPHVPNTQELAVLCGSMIGACLGFLVVQLLSGQDLHGRHRQCDAGRAAGVCGSGNAAGDHAGAGGWDLRHRRAQRGTANRVVQTDRQADLPVCADPPSFPDGRLEGDAGGDPVLAGIGDLLRGGAGDIKTSVGCC